MVTTASGSTPIEIVYTNYKGKTSKRLIIPMLLHFGHTEWHVVDQWLLQALDVEKGELRDFALKDFGEPHSLARDEWREIYRYLQSVKEPVAERREGLDGVVTMLMINVIERIVEDRLRLKAKSDLNHDMLRPFYYQCERCGGMGRDMGAYEPNFRITTCVDCHGSGFVGKKEQSIHRSVTEYEAEKIRSHLLASEVDKLRSQLRDMTHRAGDMERALQSADNRIAGMIHQSERDDIDHMLSLLKIPSSADAPPGLAKFAAEIVDAVVALAAERRALRTVAK